MFQNTCVYRNTKYRVILKRNPQILRLRNVRRSTICEMRALQNNNIFINLGYSGLPTH